VFWSVFPAAASIDTILDASVVFIFRPSLGISRETLHFTLWSSPSFSVSPSKCHLFRNICRMFFFGNYQRLDTISLPITQSLQSECCIILFATAYVYHVQQNVCDWMAGSAINSEKRRAAIILSVELNASSIESSHALHMLSIV